MECVEQIFEEYAIQQTEISKVSRPTYTFHRKEFP